MEVNISSEENHNGHKIKNRFAEQTVILISVLKWVVLATIVGSIVGLSTAIFLKVLERSTQFTGGFSYYYLALPAMLFLSALMIKYLAPDAEGHGT